MHLNIEDHGKSIIVQLTGELDHHTTEIVRNRIDRFYKEGEKVNIILDLREITFMDSSGIGLIMGRFQKVKSKDGKLLVVSDNKYVDRILDMSGLLKIVEICSSIGMAKKIIDRGEIHGK